MTENSPDKKEEQNNTDGFTKLIEAVIPLADKYLTYKQNESEARTKYFQQASKHNRNILYAMTAFLIGVIAFMSFLTWMGKVSGDALLFLVGTVTGYLILFIQKLASPTEEQPTGDLPA
jgi:uncharacterized membrane protein YjjP (DUF1212 family)